MTKLEAENQEIQEVELVEVRKIHHHDTENGSLIPMDEFHLPTDANILHHLTKIEKKLDEITRDVGAVKEKADKNELWAMDFDNRLRDVQRIGKITREQTDVSVILGQANRTHLENMQTEIKEVKDTVNEILTILKNKP